MSVARGAPDQVAWSARHDPPRGRSSARPSRRFRPGAPPPPVRRSPDPGWRCGASHAGASARWVHWQDDAAPCRRAVRPGVAPEFPRDGCRCGPERGGATGPSGRVPATMGHGGDAAVAPSYGRGCPLAAGAGGAPPPSGAVAPSRSVAATGGAGWAKEGGAIVTRRTGRWIGVGVAVLVLGGFLFSGAARGASLWGGLRPAIGWTRGEVGGMMGGWYGVPDAAGSSAVPRGGRMRGYGGMMGG